MNDDFPVWGQHHAVNFNNGPPSLSEYVTLITNSCLGLIDAICEHLINKVLLPVLQTAARSIISMIWIKMRASG